MLLENLFELFDKMKNILENTNGKPKRKPKIDLEKERKFIDEMKQKILNEYTTDAINKKIKAVDRKIFIDKARKKILNEDDKYVVPELPKPEPKRKPKVKLDLETKIDLLRNKIYNNMIDISNEIYNNSELTKTEKNRKAKILIRNYIDSDDKLIKKYIDANILLEKREAPLGGYTYHKNEVRLSKKQNETRFKMGLAEMWENLRRQIELKSKPKIDLEKERKFIDEMKQKILNEDTAEAINKKIKAVDRKRFIDEARKKILNEDDKYVIPELPKPKPKPKPKAKPTKEPKSAWISFVKKYMTDNNVDYKTAMIEAKAIYKKKLQDDTPIVKIKKEDITNGELEYKDYLKLVGKDTAKATWIKTRDNKSQIHKKIKIKVAAMRGLINRHSKRKGEESKLITAYAKGELERLINLYKGISTPKLKETEVEIKPKKQKPQKKKLPDELLKSINDTYSMRDEENKDLELTQDKILSYEKKDDGSLIIYTNNLIVGDDEVSIDNIVLIPVDDGYEVSLNEKIIINGKTIISPYEEFTI